MSTVSDPASPQGAAGPRARTRLLFLCKRRPQGRDLLQRPYGRFFNLPRELAALGHATEIILFDYANGTNEAASLNGVRIESVGLRRNPLTLLRHVRDISQSFAPDWVIGFSDIWYGILAKHIARFCGARCAIDAYDNYESYIPCALPAHLLWRRAIAHADLVTAAGQPLLDHMSRARIRGRTAVVPMAADDLFFQRDRNQCRQELGLPSDIPLIGYMGSLDPSRDIRLLIEFMQDFAERVPTARFILSGRRLQTLKLPANAIHLGYLADEQVPLLVNAMDVVLSLNLPSQFGEHSYPAKIYEAAACNVPFVATSTLATRWMTTDRSASLCPAGDLDALITNVLASLHLKSPDASLASTWSDSAIIFANAMDLASLDPTD